MDLTPETIKAVGEAAIGVLAALGAIITPIVAFFTWKTRYQLDFLYSATYRPNPDGTPGPMRHHPDWAVKFFKSQPRNPQDTAVPAIGVGTSGGTQADTAVSDHPPTGGVP